MPTGGRGLVSERLGIAYMWWPQCVLPGTLGVESQDPNNAGPVFELALPPCHCAL